MSVAISSAVEFFAPAVILLGPRPIGRGRSFLMSNEINDEVLTISDELKEHLKFYREIGIEDIGSAGATELAPEAISTSKAFKLEADSKSLPSVPSQGGLDPRIDDATTTELTGGAEQPTLFEQSISRRITPAMQRTSVAFTSPGDVSLEAIRDDLGDCQRCKLHEHRRTIVFGEGNPRAKLVFVGEGPGAEEDATGRPFVGRAGQLLDKIIAAIGLKREEVYIANIVKCRPPGNRTPESDEVDTCQPFLFRQIALIAPMVIVALGSPAFQCLLRTREPITRARGQWRELNGIRVMPTFHPAFLLRSPDKKREVWEDMKKVRDYLNSK